MKNTCRLILALGLLLAVPAASAEERKTTDERFAEARQLAFDDRRVESRVILYSILETSPDYLDVQVFLARTWAWDKEYENARDVLDKLLAESPGYADARVTRIDVEMWSDHFDAALHHANAGLEIDPFNTDYLIRKAKAQEKLGLPQEAAETARTILAVEPDSDDARILYRNVLDDLLPNKVGIDYEFESFDDSTADWQITSLDYRRSFGFGSMIARMNYADRFDKNGTQFEVDAYPGLARKTYAFVSLGYSTSSLFPELRYSGEVFHNFPDGWEGSAGFRRLEFSSSDVTIYTGTVAKYFGSYWLSFRPNYVDKADGTSTSGRVSLRRYYGGRDEYWEVAAGGGVGKGDGSVITELEDQLDSSIRFEINKRVMHKLLLRAKAGVRREELTGGQERDSWFLGIGFARFF